MKVRCINNDPEKFPIEPPFRDAFWHAPGMSMRTNTFDGIEVGRTYVVYTLTLFAGFPFYYVPCRHHDDSWVFAPSLCFEILDNRLSKLWHVGMEARPKMPVAVMAIREWVEEPDFHARLVDCRERELDIMKRAVAFMNSEYD